MEKTSPLLIMPFFLLFFGCKQKGTGLEEGCENFQFFGALYEGEIVSIKFNSKVIYEDYFEKEARTFLPLCVDYTDTFNVNLKIVKGDRIIVDTTMIGYAKNGTHLLRLPMGDPKPEIAAKVIADTTMELYKAIPKDSLLRRVFLEPRSL